MVGIPAPRMVLLLTLSWLVAALSAQTTGPELPVARVVLFSSGVGYFEHRGQVSGDASVALRFSSDEVNDALKSLVIWDASTASPSVSYPSEESLDRALKGFRVDLSGSPRIAELLARLRGAEVSIDTPDTITGKIVGVEARPDKEGKTQLPYLVLATEGGIKAVSLNELAAIRFGDKRISEDFDRALALILSAQDRLRRVLDIRLPGTGTRQARLGYVVAAPVWKVSYRLDMSGDKPFLQGWAIVDNPTDQDWTNVNLSLVSGRPVSFIQDLYTPLYVDRPVIPLAIAGTAAPRTFDSGMAPSPEEELMAEAEPAAKMAAPAPAPPMSRAQKAAGPGAGFDLASSAVETTQARAAGDQFEFTVKKPVTLERRRSAMIGLVSGEIALEKLSVFSPGSGSRNPMLGARISNSTGTKLPAGPITIFDGGVYAGDALLDFLPEKEKRLIVFGTDLSVTGDVTATSSQETIGVKVSKGVLIFSRRTTWTRGYQFRNSGLQPKKVLVEHPITGGAELFEPKVFDEKTDSVYRFLVSVPAGGQAKLDVKERSPAQESVALSSLSTDSFLRYSSSQEIPQAIRDALKQAMDLRRKVDDSRRALSDLQARKNEISNDQARIRQNLGAVGRDTSQGQQYLKRL
ncbi:MAG TPA: hypothetical protein VFL04_02385, partial [Rectinemataceae bacterium]|nr:hypothetical protein [Rectinemataceae bacterium]